MKDRPAMLSDINTFADRVMGSKYMGLQSQEIYGNAKFDLGEEREEPEAKGDEIGELADKCWDNFLSRSWNLGDYDVGEHRSMLKPLIGYSKAQEKIALDEFRRRRALGSIIKERDELIHKLREALKPEPLPFEECARLENAGLRTIKKPDPEIMEEE